MLHPSGVNEYLVFLKFAADDGHLGDSACGEQSRTEIPVGEGAKVAHGCRVCRKADDEKLAEYRRLRTDHRTVDVVGQCVGHRGQFLGDDLPVAIDVGAPVKFHPYHGKTVGRRRPHAPDAGSAVDGCLYLECDELLHLLGCHAVGFGHDHHRRGVEVGKNIHLRPVDRENAGHDEQHGRHEHEQTVVERKSDYLVKHIGDVFVSDCGNVRGFLRLRRRVSPVSPPPPLRCRRV